MKCNAVHADNAYGRWPIFCDFLCVNWHFWNSKEVGAVSVRQLSFLFETLKELREPDWWCVGRDRRRTLHHSLCVMRCYVSTDTRREFRQQHSGNVVIHWCREDAQTTHCSIILLPSAAASHLHFYLSSRTVTNNCSVFPNTNYVSKCVEQWSSEYSAFYLRA